MEGFSEKSILAANLTGARTSWTLGLEEPRERTLSGTDEVTLSHELGSLALAEGSKAESEALLREI